MTQLVQLQDALYGRDGLGVSNFKLFPGTNREATSEDIARQINAALAEFTSGAAEPVDIQNLEF